MDHARARLLLYPVVYFLLCLFMPFVMAVTLKGTVHDVSGTPLTGALITLSDANGLHTESVYSNESGRFSLDTGLQGQLLVRARRPRFRDVTRKIDLDEASSVRVEFVLPLMEEIQEISDTLPASAHFSRLKFASNKEKQWFLVDCAGCHQIGNAYTRGVKPPEYWDVLMERMAGFAGVTDPDMIAAYRHVLSRTFDGSPVTLEQSYVIDPMIYPARILEWRLPRASVAHDVEYSHDNGKFFTVDQGSDHIYITDPETHVTDTVVIPDDGNPIGGKFMRLMGISNPLGLAVARGPHSLQFGPDKRIYMTYAVSGDIGVFDPGTGGFTSHAVGEKGLYPHTLRFDKQGRAWFTLSISNQLGYYDTRTGEMRLIDLPADTDRKNVQPRTPYGIDIHPLDGSIWYSAMYANRIGRIDPDTLVVQVYTPPLVGPRRLRFAADGTLWIPGFGSGTLVKLDTQTMQFTSYRIPTLSAEEVEAPYAVGVHPDTGDIWITANLSDRVFRFLPQEERFIVYPLPTRGTYLRDMIFTPKGWVCGSSSPVPPAVSVEGGMQAIVCVDPGR